jgi:hypothetical protein
MYTMRVTMSEAINLLFLMNRYRKTKTIKQYKKVCIGRKRLLAV